MSSLLCLECSQGTRRKKPRAEHQHLHRQTPSASPMERFQLPPEGMPFDEIEQRFLEEAMRIANANQSRAAKLLHMSRDTFRYRLEKYGLI